MGISVTSLTNSSLFIFKQLANLVANQFFNWQNCKYVIIIGLDILGLSTIRKLIESGTQVPFYSYVKRRYSIRNSVIICTLITNLFKTRMLLHCCLGVFR